MLLDLNGQPVVDLGSMASSWILPCHACVHGRKEPRAQDGVCCGIDAYRRCKPYLPVPQGKLFYKPDKRGKKYLKIVEQDQAESQEGENE